MIETEEFMGNLNQWSDTCLSDGRIGLELYEKYGARQRLHDENGNDVVTGLTKVSKTEANKIVDGVRVLCGGELFYRDYSIYDLVGGVVRENRYGFEEVAYLLLLGELPNTDQFTKFKKNLTFSRILPTNFIRDIIMKAPTKDIMISLSKSILTLASYDEKAWDITVPNVLKQYMMLISVMPMLAVYGYHAYNHYEKGDSMYVHRLDRSLPTTENLLRLLRPDTKYSQMEAHMLDLALILHMKHDGGNNSTLATHVATPSGTDTYSVISAALASLKGPKHDGANIKAVEIIQDSRNEIEDVTDRGEAESYLKRLPHKEVFGRKGLIYGMDHAVYSKSDSRAEIFKRFMHQLSGGKGRMEEFALYSMVKELDPKIITKGRRIYKDASANVGFYNGLVHSVLDIPEEMLTPVFTIARIVGWNVHRIGELINMDKIARPTYTNVMEEENCKPLCDRQQELFLNPQV